MMILKMNKFWTSQKENFQRKEEIEDNYLGIEKDATDLTKETTKKAEIEQEIDNKIVIQVDLEIIIKDISNQCITVTIIKWYNFMEEIIIIKQV